MPNVGGLELLERISEANLNVVAVIMTGFGTVETAIEAMKRGAYDYITKPFNRDELRMTLDKALEAAGIPRADVYVTNAVKHFKWEPRAGFEYDNVISAKAGDPEGTTVRTYEEIGLYLYPFGGATGDKLVLSATWAHRYDLTTPASVARDNHYLRTYSALLYLDSARRIAVGVDRVSGQDPSAGFREQRAERE